MRKILSKNLCNLSLLYFQLDLTYFSGEKKTVTAQRLHIKKRGGGWNRKWAISFEKWAFGAITVLENIVYVFLQWDYVKSQGSLRCLLFSIKYDQVSDICFKAEVTLSRSISYVSFWSKCALPSLPPANFCKLSVST